MKPERNRRTEKDWRPVARGIGPDVPEEIYQEELNSLVKFVSEFDAKKRTYRVDELIPKIEDNSIAIETVIRAVGDIEKSEVDDEVYYTYIIKTSSFKASHLPERGIIEILFISELGIDKQGKPLGGYRLRLPDGSGSAEWLKPRTKQLEGYDRFGVLNDTVDINNPGSIADVKLIGDRYKEAVSHIIEFADSKK